MAQTEVDARSIFAQRLKAAREDAGLTQKELGMSVGLPQETAAVRINRYEKGVHDADLATARRIAQSLGVPLAFLYADTDVLAEAILTLGLLSKSEQRKAVADLKARLAQAGADRPQP
ncbi:helix-turn-helix domain-containing protein [Lysobacter sp. BMK333-48F3]|uniref:helix-turn-helix transcriptional regulator n=1 Tax=Lysobacter sp. BMK333-48F3 TaxID=2867962 RepID=UPI001C8B42C1|nr:helix-turn-helix transcriptional regulator [Lysobacter sp. BMK333-48F3]MBX9401496.1 helix-turn-helix domain-containing protein [Lysobacter sp. BMK333-48F3]